MLCCVSVCNVSVQYMVVYGLFLWGFFVFVVEAISEGAVTILDCCCISLKYPGRYPPTYHMSIKK